MHTLHHHRSLIRSLMCDHLLAHNEANHTRSHMHNVTTGHTKKHIREHRVTHGHTWPHMATHGHTWSHQVTLVTPGHTPPDHTVPDTGSHLAFHRQYTRSHWVTHGLPPAVHEVTLGHTWPATGSTSCVGVSRCVGSGCTGGGGGRRQRGPPARCHG